MLTPLLVAARIVANPVSNVFQKQLAGRSASPIFIIAATHALLTPLCLPFLPGTGARALGVEFWTNMAICAALAVAGNALMVRALDAADLSLLGPINAYKPVISLLPGVFLIGEVPTPLGLVGMVLILAGSSAIVDRAPKQSRGSALAGFFRDPGVRLRFAALALSATEAVFLKRALLLSSPLTAFVFWSILGLPVAAVAVAVLEPGRLGDEAALFRRSWPTYLWLAAATGTMQLATLLTFGRLQVGASLALFQLSALLGVFLGHRVFREGNVRKRLIGSAVMVAGAVLIGLWGRPA